MHYRVSESDTAIEISLTGRLTFTDNTEFRNLISELNHDNGGKIVVDLAGLEFIDSAGLGLLLLLREDARKKNCSITLRSTQGQVKRMMEIARFDTMFDVEG